MPRTRRVSIAAALCLLASGLAAGPATRPEASQVSDGSRFSEEVVFRRLQSLGKTARTHEPSAVRAVTDAIVDGNLLTAGAPNSIRARIANADIAIRRGAYRAIPLKDAAAAINALVEYWHLPEYYRTTEAQLATFRSDYSYVTRDIALPTLTQLQGGAMAPNEALFVISEMTLQKVLVEENRVAPEAWDARRAQRERDFRVAMEARKGPDAMRSEAKMSFKTEQSAPPDLPQLDFSTESASGTVEVHRLLDALGIPRQ